MRRLTVIAALGALLCVLGGVVTASPALAGRGPKWQLGSAEPFTLPALFCGFEVRVTPVVNKEFTKILKTADGSMTFLFTGAFAASLTNLQNGKTITENMSGPGKATIHADGTITEVHTGLNGPNFLAPANQARFGLPGLFISTGALRFSVDAAGNTTSLTLNGRVAVDLCAALS
jgi:hypothetical protein